MVFVVTMIMFPPWRFKLRQAQVALDEGRLDEAAQIAGRAELNEYLPVRQLLGQVSQQLSRRALERAAAGDFATAWRDLDSARGLAGETADWQRLQQAVADVAISDVLTHLKASDFHGAAARLEALNKRRMPGVGLQTLTEVAKRLESASKLLARGKFAEAEAQLVAAIALRPDLKLIEEQLHACRERVERSRALSEQLHAAIAAAEWTKVAALAGELLEIAPEHRVARDARRRAWAEVGQRAEDSRHLTETQHWGGSKDEREASVSRYVSIQPNDATKRDVTGGLTSPARQPASKFMLWIDAVGGYLVCLADEVIFGQALPGAAADVPIQADISRKHAKLIRHAEGYVLEPLGGKTLLNGRAIQGPALIGDNDEIGLGDAVKLRFRKPHVLSSSARLEIISGHRTLPYADAVILMAESCVLGPKWQNHVVCRDWAGDVVLYRADDAIMCRSMDSIEIDGQLVGGRGAVQPGSRVMGTDFSLSIEGV
jgi:hypothetical protein